MIQMFHSAPRYSFRMSDDIASLRRILKTCRTVAVVGLSAEWHRPSFFVAKYLQEHGYRVIPVNPRYAGGQILGEPVFASLADITEPVDMVDVFRRSEDVGPIAEQAIRMGAKCLWQQIGVANAEADAAVRAAGLDSVGVGDGPAGRAPASCCASISTFSS